MTDSPSPAVAPPRVGMAAVLDGGLTLLLVPLFVVSQWLATRWHLPARTAFNALAYLALLGVLVTHRNRLARARRELILGGGLLAVIVVSIVVNRVPLGVAARGALPYAALAVAVPVVLLATPPRRAVVAGAGVAVAVAVISAISAVAEQVGGRAAFVALAQDLRYPRWWERGRATGLVANPGRLAQLGLALIPISVPSGGWALAGVIAGGVAAATSAGRIVALAGVLLLVVAALARGWAGRSRLAVGAGAALVTLGLVLVVVPSARHDFFGRVDASLGTGSGEITDVRTANIQASSRLLADRPLLGAGPGRFGSTTAFATRSPLHQVYGLPDVRSPQYVQHLRAIGDYREIDVGNAQLDLGLLQVATELGALGLVVALALLGSLLLRALRARSLLGVSLLGLLGVFSLAGPGLVDPSLAVVLLWWAGTTITAEPRP